MSKYNMLNDLDGDIFNLWNVFHNHYEELLNAIENAPHDKTLFHYFKKKNNDNNTMKALRFIYLSNYSLYGKSDALKFGCQDSKKILLDNYKKTIKFYDKCQFLNRDFRIFFREIRSIFENNEKTILCYCDPPYYETEHNYSNKFTVQDTVDLFELMVSLSKKFHKFVFFISEFKNDFILDLIEKNKFKFIVIQERQTLKNRNTEILITNSSIII